MLVAALSDLLPNVQCTSTLPLTIMRNADKSSVQMGQTRSPLVLHANRDRRIVHLRQSPYPLRFLWFLPASLTPSVVDRLDQA